MRGRKAIVAMATAGLAFSAPAMAQTAAAQRAGFDVTSLRTSAPGASQSQFARMRNDDLDRGGRGKGKDNGHGHDDHGNGHGYGHGSGHCDNGDRCHASPG